MPRLTFSARWKRRQGSSHHKTATLKLTRTCSRLNTPFKSRTRSTVRTWRLKPPRPPKVRQNLSWTNKIAPEKPPLKSSVITLWRWLKRLRIFGVKARNLNRRTQNDKRQETFPVVSGFQGFRKVV